MKSNHPYTKRCKTSINTWWLMIKLLDYNLTYSLEDQVSSKQLNLTVCGKHFAIIQKRGNVYGLFILLLVAVAFACTEKYTGIYLFVMKITFL